MPKLVAIAVRTDSGRTTFGTIDERLTRSSAPAAASAAASR